MLHRPGHNLIKSPKPLTYIIAFLLAFHFALPLYINSTFLSEIIPEKSVGLIFTLGSILGIISLYILPRFLKFFGNFKMAIFALSAQFTTLVLLAFSHTPIVIIAAITTFLISGRLILYHLNIFVEAQSEDSTTGNTRGIFLTALNTGIIAGPITLTFLLKDNEFFKAYLLAALLLIPTAALLYWSYSKFKDPKYERLKPFDGLKEVIATPALRDICAAQLLLFLFYSWMVIYTPIYLTEHIGFSWSSIGAMFTIMLLPFVLFAWPLGKLADSKIGEREILTAGFIIMAAAVALLSFFTVQNPLLWGAILFFTRVGASMAEIMIETYFYKHVNAEDSHLISIYSMVRPLGYVVGPALATITLLFVNIQFIFLALSGILLLGVPIGLRLKDTK